MENTVKFDTPALCALLSLLEMKLKDCSSCSGRGCKTCVCACLIRCEDSIRESMHLPKKSR